MDFFKINSNNHQVRTGTLHFLQGSVKTPTFMPVGTRGAIKCVPPELVRSTQAGILLGNTYHLSLNPGSNIVQAAGGLSKFTNWLGPTLTDSGGFQVFSLGKIRTITEEGVTFKNPNNGDSIFISPEISMQIQHELGADIIMAFDDVIDLENERHRAKDALERTHRWLVRCIVEHQKLSANKKNPPKLFGIFQGGLDKELRLESLEFVKSQPVDGIAIGGLSVGETRAEMHDMLEFLAPHYDTTRPCYLMGVGHPTDLRFAFSHGVDMADCVLPTRNARHGSVWINSNNQHSPDLQINLKNKQYESDFQPIEPGCDCYACSNNFTRAWFRHQFKVGEPLAGAMASVHNIRYLMRIAEEFQKK